MTAIAPDITALVTRVLADDTTIAGVFNGRIFGESIPKDTASPLILVRTVARRLATQPSLLWWTSVTAIDIHHTSALEGLSYVPLVIDLVSNLEGIQHPEEIVLQDTTISGAITIPDAGYTPMRFRQVVTVETTARTN